MSKKSILILGTGFIGSRLKEFLPAEISDRQIFSYEDILEDIKKYNPRIIINAIGATGKSNVDDCEANKNTTLWANSFIPILVAEAAIRYKIKLVHISSGCIYQYDYKHDKPIVEEKTPDFSELFYSRSKIYAEQALLPLCDKHNILIARIRIPLDNKPHPRNILTKLINYKTVIDVPNSLTYLPDFAQALKHLLRIDAHGLYNVVNKGGLRYPELLDEYAKHVSGYSYTVMPHQKLNLVRTNLIMSVEKLEKSGFKIRRIQDVLAECVKEYITADRRKTNADDRRLSTRNRAENSDRRR